jgi:UDP-3-O-[3-hydroxymyristoyl] glucosamine N-acyltransferase
MGMILNRIFLKLKSPEVADSWFMHTSFIQNFIKICLKMYNRTAPKLPICTRVRTGSLGTGNQIHTTAIIDYGRVIIGDSCSIEKNVVIEKNSIIGSHVTISQGAVIGSEGFEQRRIAGEVIPVAHLGGVIINDDVVLGSRVCVDRSALGEYTEIGRSSTIQANVQIGHGIKIGRHVTVSEGTMIGGYVTLGDHVVIGRHCSLADGIILQDGVTIPDNSVITHDIENPADSTVPKRNFGSRPESVEGR